MRTELYTTKTYPIYQNRKPVVSANSVNPTFTGVTRLFSNAIHIDGQKDIDLLLKRYPDSYHAVGQLPTFLLKRLPKENTSEAVREILKIFDNIALKIRGYVPTGDSYLFNPSRRFRPDEVNNELSEVLRKYKILSRFDDDIDVKYIDQGGKGKVFKLEGLRDPDTEDEYVIKVFHQIKGKNWHPYKSHGCYAEINNGMYWRAQEGHDTHRGKFFFANLDSGYIVSKFLDEDVPRPKRIVPEYKYGIKCTDEAAKDSNVLVGYNCIKGYFYDNGGMRVVNRIKNSNKKARLLLAKMKHMPDEKRADHWNFLFQRQHCYNKRFHNDDVPTGLALSIKYLDKKNPYIDKCINLKKPKVNQALAYVLKYLPHKDAVKYFDKLMNTNDEITQVILMNEIPLLAKRKTPGAEIVDDINTTLLEIVPERVNKFYEIAQKHAMPSTVEHLASFVHLLPKEKIQSQCDNLLKVKNPLLQERLIWKLSMLPREIEEYAVKGLAKTVADKKIARNLMSYSQKFPEIKPDLEKILQQ